MILCPHCATQNPPRSNFCQQCGKSLAAAPPSDATVMLTATQVGVRAPKHQDFDVTSLFKGKSRIVIGRASDCDLHLPHPSVSRYHARLERRPDGLYLVDLASVNGVWLAGRRLTEATLLQEGDRIGIGPYLLSITHGVLHSLDNSRSLRLEARELEKVVVLPGGAQRKLLENISLVVQPGEFVSLLGPSGSGKSTLMDCLNGRRRATGGQVLANGEDFYKHFDSFRRSLGYVPQRDIVHAQLTVYRALYYTARLRLPLDTEHEELTFRIEEVLKEMELRSHRDTLIANLSGGQIKRVSLGAELLGQPAFLYIDEATSGLDAGTESRMMRLFRHLAEEGRSILCITHNVENVEQCHLILILARGKLIYYGPPQQAPGYFKVRRIGEIYDRIAERDPQEWEHQFRESSLYADFVAERLTEKDTPCPVPVVPEQTQDADSPSGLQAVLAESRKLVEERVQLLADYFRQLEMGNLRRRELLSALSDTWNQLGILTVRYLDLLWADRRGLRLLLLQAPLVALFLLVGFAGQEFTREMPLLRPLHEQERQALRALQGLNELLDSKRPLTEEQREVLRKIQLQVVGYPVKLDGNAIVVLLRRILREEITPAERAALSQARIRFNLFSESMDLSGQDLVKAVRYLQQARFSEQLLQANGSVVPEGVGINPRFTYILLFILAMIVLWFGCNNASKEIVKEEAIYSRERAVNLRITPYLASKFIVLSLITILQVALLMVLVYGGLELLAHFEERFSVPPSEHMLSYVPQFGILSLLAMVGVALGLLLSACVATPDRANALLPYVLIPQMILGGGILSVEQGLLHYLAWGLSPVYWAYRAIHLGTQSLSPDFPGYANYSDGLQLPCLALLIHLVLLLTATWWCMKLKDV